MATMQPVEQTLYRQVSDSSSTGRPRRSPSCSTVSSGSTASLATPTNWKPEPPTMKEKQLSLEHMMIAQQTHQQQQQFLQQQAQMQMYINTSIAYAQQQFSMQQQEHLANSWKTPPSYPPVAKVQRAKTIDKHIKATVLQSEVPQYQEYRRPRHKPKVIPSPASVFAKSRLMSEANDDDDKPLAFIQERSNRKVQPPMNQGPGPRRPIAPAHDTPTCTVKAGQKPHRRSPLAECITAGPVLPDAVPDDNDDIDDILDMYQDFTLGGETDNQSVTSAGSESSKSFFSWLKGSSGHSKVKPAKRVYA
ncbi:hypothetical protein INT43_003697 [Umbelopsis isabellina]|uniref:Uncharacterized protein n=1 Tax=Mortierella isabellina TaxID=91625 RepID=A0A8H7PVD4_MORIS|nr:hypothetical protein INT43_003697 [Umbelopsis isabellina]